MDNNPIWLRRRLLHQSLSMGGQELKDFACNQQ
jgi:hypothetical protein